MNIEQIQNYFKNEIVKGNYEITHVINPSRYSKGKWWLSILVEDRPFNFEVSNNTGNITQDGDIFENYIQLGEFSKEQQEVIIERLNGL